MEAVIEVRGEESVTTKPKIRGNYIECYISTRSPKLREAVDIKEIIVGENSER